MRFVRYFVGLCFCFALAMPACAPPQMQLNFLYERGGDKPPDSDDNKFDKILFTLQGKDDFEFPPNSKNNPAKDIRWGDGNEKTWNKGEELKLPILRCPNASRWAGYNPTAGGIYQISPFLEALAMGADNKTIFTARYPLYVACRWQKATFFFSKPWHMTPWLLKESDDDSPKLARVGHRLTRIANGHYLLSGGVNRFSIGGIKAPMLQIAKNSFHDSLYILVPGAQDASQMKRLQSITLQPARAFHTATWSTTILGHEQILLTGGVVSTDKGMAISTQAQAILFSNKQQKDLSEKEKAACDWRPEPSLDNTMVCTTTPEKDTQRAFQVSLRVPRNSAPTEADTFQIGGISDVTLDGVAKKSAESHQILFHSAAYLPPAQATCDAGSECGSILVTGGFYIQPDSKQLLATNFVFELELDRDNRITNLNDYKIFIPKTAKGGQPLQPRAGHTSLVLNRDHVLLIGGVRGSLNEPDPLDANKAFLPQTLGTVGVLTRDGDTWVATEKAVSNADVALGLRRSFHVAQVIKQPLPGISGDAKVVLLAGGILGRSGNNGLLHTTYDLLKIAPDQQPELLSRGTSNHLYAFHSANTLETGQIALFGGARFTLNDQGVATFVANKQSDSSWNSLFYNVHSQDTTKDFPPALDSRALKRIQDAIAAMKP